MNRRELLKAMLLGAAAVPVRTYFDMGRGLWRQDFSHLRPVFINGRWYWVMLIEPHHLTLL
jgi:hypothetical protein